MRMGETYWEPLMFASGLSSNPNRNNSYILKKGLNSVNILSKRAAIAGAGYVDPNNKKTLNDGKKLIKQGLNDPSTVIRKTAALSLAKLAIFSIKNEKQRKKLAKEVEKLTKKDDSSIVQGASIGLGLLSKYVDLKPVDEKYDFIVADPIRLESSSYYLLGISLYGIGTKTITDSIIRILNMVKRLTDKTAKRTAAITLGFLIPQLEFEEMISYLETFLKSKIEYQSMYGSDTAIILSYLKLLEKGNKSELTVFINKLKEWKEFDEDYAEIYDIITSKIFAII